MQEQVVDVLGNVERPLVLAGRSEQRDDEPTGPGDVVEVVCEPRLQPVQILHPRLEEGKNGFRDETPDTIAIHHQHRHPLPPSPPPPRHDGLVDHAPVHRLCAAAIKWTPR
jgi:hypothetical protein